ncbi:Hypothetical predicted protein [Cloeon dipterum]|uniref:Uncharacterized protein n=1 Tax=Cloeon dipterum TaxID=197152 RepID=A0A8S1DCX7_9INSE|nr:Hypothetical predicted protein [Cloeon dipterum]
MDRFVMFYLQNRHRGPTLNDALLNLVVGESGRDEGAIGNVRATANDKSLRWTTDGEQLPGGSGAAAFDAVQHSCEARSEMGSVVCSGRLELTDVPVLQSLVPAQVGARSTRTSLTFHRLTRRLLASQAEMKARLAMSAPPPTASLRWMTSSFPIGKNGSGGLGGREGLDWRWKSGGPKEDQEQKTPETDGADQRGAEEALAKTRSDAAAEAEVETVAAERTASTSEWEASSAVGGSREGCHGSGEQREDAGGGSEGRGRRGVGEPCPCPGVGNAGGAGHRGESQHVELVHTRPARQQLQPRALNTTTKLQNHQFLCSDK